MKFNDLALRTNFSGIIVATNGKKWLSWADSCSEQIDSLAAADTELDLFHGLSFNCFNISTDYSQCCVSVKDILFIM